MAETQRAHHHALFVFLLFAPKRSPSPEKKRKEEKREYEYYFT